METLLWLKEELQTERLLIDDFPDHHTINLNSSQMHYTRNQLINRWDFQLTLFKGNCDSLLREIEIEMQYARKYCAGIKFITGYENKIHDMAIVHEIWCTISPEDFFGNFIAINFLASNLKDKLYEKDCYRILAEPS